MISRRRFRFVGGLPALFLLAQLTKAQEPKKPIFVSAEQLRIASVMPAPPAMNSDQTGAELAELHKLQNSRTAAEIERAKTDDAEEDIFIFKNVLGEKFNREALPLTAQLSDHVHNDEGIVVNPAKDFFKRPRPYQFDSTISPVCKATSKVPDAYPSGHGTTGYLEAMVATLIVPEKRDVIFGRLDEYLHNRLVCGVHYASDVSASRSVAYAMIAIMLDNPQFKRELDAARAETRHVLGLPLTN